MDNIKITLTMSVPGAKLLSDTQCKENKTFNKIALTLNEHDPQKKEEHIVLFTRKPKAIKQVVNMTEETYNYFISEDIPYNYKMQKSSTTKPAWKSLSKEQKVEWHLREYCLNFKAKLISYKIYD